MDSEILNQLPETETCWVRYHNSENELTHLITSHKTMRYEYYLYEIKNGKPIRTAHKAENPKDLEKYIPWLKAAEERYRNEMAD